MPSRKLTSARHAAAEVEDAHEDENESGSENGSESDHSVEEDAMSDSEGDARNQSVGSASESGSDSGEDGSGSESDSLDSEEPRKRRKTSAATVPPAAASSVNSVFSAPSRIKQSQSRSKGLGESSQQQGTPASAAAEDAGSKIIAPTDPNTTFESLGVKPWLVRSLASMAIRRPTGIQKACIPEILSGRDCIGGSRTGSGKTVAFAVPILQKLFESPSAIYGLILTPTRELALQIFEQLKAISAPQNLKVILVTGGADMRPQAIALCQRPHIVVATPGRLADHIRTSGEDTVCGLRRVRVAVLDEADRLLASDGPGSMLPDVEACLSVLAPPASRQTLLFTATVTPEVRALKDAAPRPGRAPPFVCEVDTDALAIPPTLRQTHLQVPVTHREHYLHALLLTEANAERSAIVFCNRGATAAYLHHLLFLLGHRVVGLYGTLPQAQRTANLGRFRAAAARVLVATDVAARGLDIPEVALVVNYDVPRDPDVYIHRVGRTARAGRKGDAVTLVGQRDVDLVLAIEQRVGRPMDAWTEEGVNLETRVVRDLLKVMGEKKREALLDIEERREVGGKRKRGKVKLRALE